MQERNSEHSPLLVGVGASAGGLQAIEGFLTPLPGKMAFSVVVIQHLSSQHKNHLPALIRSFRSELEIIEISDHLPLLPGKIYLSPPGGQLLLEHGVFHVLPQPDSRIRLPIDDFLVSLAEEAGDRAVAVILSGEGNDGAKGIRAIRSAGGAVFVQEPSTAEFVEMPLAAISTGLADAVLPPGEIAAEILKLQVSKEYQKVDEPPLTSSQYEIFYRLLREKTGGSFDQYKKSVVTRRIRRRMYLEGIASIPEYLEAIAENDREAALLASDLMIGVTAFFRDRVAWRALRIEVVGKLVEENDDSPLRVWTPACATGEEAYSVAMMLHRELARAGKKREIQVFATDVNDQALERAREARYPGSIAADVPSDYLRNYFVSSEDGLFLTVSKEIRECVVFARQDLLADPPFSRLHAIICRNLLIYLELGAQEKCISLFHYALNNGGYLFLGNAESVGNRHTHFKTIGHKNCRIYQKIEARTPSRLPIAVPHAIGRSATPVVKGAPALEYIQSIAGSVQDALLEEFAPAAVAVDQYCTIIYHNGPTNRYLFQPRGVPTQNLLELLPKTLRSRIRAGLHRALNEDKPVSLRTAILGAGEQKRQVTLRISKLKEEHFLILFQEKAGAAGLPDGVSPEAEGIEETAVQQLERELVATRQDLQNHIEQLRGLNEEMQSSNEELQAANEELETSREELQSLNEELISVNAQLQGKIEEQDATNNDLNNFLAGTSIPTLFLDHQFRLKRFTPAISQLIKLIPADVGRPIKDMSRENLGPDLIEEAQAVLDNLAPIKKEIPVGDACYIRTILPYRTLDNRIEGVVVTYQDVSELKKAEAQVRHLASFPELNPYPVLELDDSGKIIYANPATRKFLESCGLDRGESQLFLPADLGKILATWDKETESTLYREITIRDRIWRAGVHLAPRFKAIRIYAREITEQKRAERVLQARLRLVAGAYTGAMSLDEILRQTLDEIEAQTGSLIGFYHFLAADQETLSLQNWSSNTVQTMCTAEGRGSHYSISQAGVWVDCIRERKAVIHNDYASLSHRRGMPEGHAPIIREMVIPIFRNDRIVAIIGLGNKPVDYTVTDIEIASLLGDYSWEIIERKKAEMALRESEERLVRSQEIAHLGSWELDLVNNRLFWSDETYRIFGLEPQEFSATYEAFLEAVHPDDREAVDAAYTSSLRAGSESYEIEHRIVRRKTGEIRYVNEKCIHSKDGQGKVIRSAGMVHDITDHKRAEQDLQESEERFRGLSETMPQLVWVIDADGNTTYFNGQWEEYGGHSPRTSEERQQLVHPDDLLGVNSCWQQALHSEEDFECEYRIRRHDGQYRWFLTRASRIRNAAGRTEGWIGTSTDIHALKQAEEERGLAAAFLHMLNESEETDDLIRKAAAFFKRHVPCEAVGIRLRRGDDYPYYEASGFSDEFVRKENLLCCRDESGTPVRDGAGKAMLACLCGKVITGVSEPGLSFRTERGSLWVNSSAELLALTTGNGAQIHLRNRCPGEGFESIALIPLISGTERLGLLQLNDRRKEQFSAESIAFWERIAGHLAVALMKFNSEEELRTNELQLRKIIENLNDGLVVADSWGTIFHWNPAAVAMLGFKDMGELRSRQREIPDLFEVSTIEGDAVPPLQRPLARVLRGEILQNWELRIHRQDREWQRVFNYSGTLVKDEKGKPLAAVLTFADITDRKRSDESIRRLNLDISAKNTELEAANRDLASFIYSVSHDLRGPLRSMNVFTRILAEKHADSLDERGKDYFNRVRAAGNKVNRLIEDLLYLSRVSRQEITRTPVDLGEMALHIIAELRDHSPERNVEVEIGAGLVVLADRQLLELVLSNLVTNAWKYTSKKERAHISLGRLEEQGNVIYYVKDNGAGFNPEYADKMFHPFRRLHSDDEFEGTGIGLAIVEQAIRRHGGRVWADGAVGEGATVYFTLD